MQLRRGTAKQINKYKKRKKKKDQEDSCTSGNPEVLVIFTPMHMHMRWHTHQAPRALESQMSPTSLSQLLSPESPILGWSAPQQSVLGTPGVRAQAKDPCRSGHCPCSLPPSHLPSCPLRTHLQGDTVVWELLLYEDLHDEVSSLGQLRGGVKK